MNIGAWNISPLVFYKVGIDRKNFIFNIKKPKDYVKMGCFHHISHIYKTWEIGSHFNFYKISFTLKLGL